MECCYPIECGEYTVAPMLVPPCCTKKCCEQEPQCYPRLPRCQKPVYYCCEPKPAKPPEPVYYCCEPKPSKPPKPVYYCCEMKPPKPRQQEYDCCDPPPQKGCCAPPPCENPCPPPQYCKSCCYPPPCKPVKTKYIMPCYRYEDGRIVRRLPVTAFKRNGMQDQEHSKIGTANFLVRHPRDVAVECEVRQAPVRVQDPAKTNQPTVLMRRACEVACGTRKRKPFVVSSYAADPHNEIRRYHSEDERGNCCFHFERKKPTQCEKCWAPCQPCAPWQIQSPCSECQYVDCVYSQPANPPSCCYYCC